MNSTADPKISGVSPRMQFSSEDCDKTFESKASLRAHERRHNLAKRYQCATCDFRSKDNQALLVHTRTHTGEKPFKCEICGIRISHMSNLVTHTRTHTGEKPFKCQICGKMFSRKSILVVHTRTHTASKDVGAPGKQRLVIRVKRERGELRAFLIIGGKAADPQTDRTDVE